MAREVKFEIPASAHPTECRGCKALIYWIKPKEKAMPVVEYILRRIGMMK